MAMPEQRDGQSCWWCGGVADSGEHKFKRSDLVRDFGGGSWTLPGYGVVHHDGAWRGSVRSASAERLKFPKVMCTACNTTRSQPFDLAYDRFVTHLAEHESLFVRSPTLEWRDVFGPDWARGMTNVMRYWLKHIGSRMASYGLPVPDGLISLLDLDGTSPRNVSLQLEVRLDIVAMSEHLTRVHKIAGAGGLWMGDFNTTGGPDPTYWSHWGWRWLRLNYEIGPTIEHARANFTNERVLLPTAYNVDPERVAKECMECASTRPLL